MTGKYKLYHEGTFIGTVLNLVTNFPGISGQIDYDRKILDFGDRPIGKYIDFSRQMSDKVLGDQGKYELFIESEEYKHINLIESKAWLLISNSGDRMNILAPIFVGDNELNIRLR